MALNRSVPDAADLAGRDRAAGLGAGARREAEGEALEVLTRAVGWLAPLLDGQEQLGHRAVEAVVEPGALELWPRDAAARVERDGLFGQARALAGDRALGAGDVGAIGLAEADVRV